MIKAMLVLESIGGFLSNDPKNIYILQNNAWEKPGLTILPSKKEEKNTKIRAF